MEWRRSLAIGAGGVAITAGALLGALHAAHAGEVLPGVRVLGVDVGGLSPADARARLSGAAAGFAPAVTVRADGRVYRVTSSQVGYGVDVAASVDRAMAAGREGGLWDDLASDVASLWRERSSAVRDRVDDKLLSATLLRVSRDVERVPTIGAISVDQGLSVTAVAPTGGHILDEQRLGADIRSTLRAGGGTVSVRTKPVPPRTTPEQVEEVAATARRLLAAPVAMSGVEPAVTLSPQRLGPLLRLEEMQGDRLRLGIADRDLDALVAEIAGKVDRAPVESRVAVLDAPPAVDAKGDLSWTARAVRTQVTPGTDGRRVDRARLANELRELVADARHGGVLPVTTAAPKLSARDAQRITHLLGTFTTRHACCEPRVTNIHLLADTVNGTVVRPGETFSLNGLSGPRSVAKGYRPAPTIVHGKLVDTPGGGVSQLATTLYNAVYFSGLPFSRFMAHSFYISRYPPGREATVDYPGVDLVWSNDTGAPVLIRTSYTSTSLTISVYGDNGGRTVTAKAGPREPVPGKDFRITVTRTIRYGDGRTTSLPVRTVYDKAPPGH